MVVSVVRDVTNWKNRDREIRESEERFRQIAENIGEVFWMSDPQKSRMLYVSKAYERIWGRPVASVYSEPKSFMDAIHPDDRARVEAAVGKQSEGPYDEEYRIVRPDGATRYIRDRGFPVHADDGRLYRIVGVAEDFTEEHEREERMLHAQKLESLGQLTGGVAHDFNNLLMVILGTLQLLTESDLSERDRGRVERAQRAAKKGADLTRRLMAFSRSEPLGAEVVDLNDRLSEMWPILIRDCGETIKLTFAPDPRIRNVDINAGEFESAMLNLVINARDAMPEGGRITIRTAVAAAELLPGGGKARTVDADPAVLVEVADTGAGMSQDVVQRAFEPFFTTKAVGKSIGLGLSMVHGFASQSGGRAAIESRVGEGTTVRLFLPGIGAMTGSGETPESAEPEGVRTGGSVLLVEDNADVRETTTALLDWLGYTVETADDGPMALEILDKRPNFDIVLSDVVMPKGMSGFDLAEEVSQRYPQIRILLYSGYAERSLDELSKSRLRTKILSKPLNLNDLARALGEATSS
jgi:PAS domain S-box-containing protein